MVRAPCCEKMGLKKGPWTPEEDHILISYIQRYGHENWRALPKQAGLLRCGKSCRLRWINYLRPDIKRGNFSLEEEEAIIKLHDMLGNRWSAIAAKLPGRTDNEIKNVWHTHLKKRLVKNSNNNLIVHDTKKRQPKDAVKSMKNDNDNTTVENKPISSSSSSTNNNTATNESTKAESEESFTEIMNDEFWSEVFSSNDNNNNSCATYFELENNNFYADPQIQFPLLEASDDNEDVDLVQGFSTNINVYQDNDIEFWFNVFTKDVNLPELLSQQR